MGDPTVLERGIADRATANRVAAPLEQPKERKPFNVNVLPLLGQAAIPDVLAYALEWQLQLDTMHGEPLQNRKNLAEQLIALWHFLKEMEAEAGRDPGDGALLVFDPLKALAQQKKPIEFAEIASGESVPVTREWQDVPHPAWAPSQFPEKMTAEQIARYPKRPRQVDEIPPFFPDNVRLWIALHDFRPPPTPIQPSERARAKESYQAVDRDIR